MLKGNFIKIEYIKSRLLYKGIALMLCGSSSGVVSYSQAVGNPASNIPITPVTPSPLTAPYPLVINLDQNIKKNFIRTWIPDEPTTNINSSVKHRKITEYFDGLGRSLQTVNFKGHADGYDIIQHHVYDNIGRESIQFLPFTAQETSSDGNLQYNAKMRIEQFYPLADGQQPYSQKAFDNSPLNLLVKESAPGKSWVGSGRGKEYSYKTNTDESYLLNGATPIYYVVKSSIPRFSINGSNVLQYEGNYTDGQLFITRVTDEDGIIVEEIKDKQDKVIAKRQLAKSVSGLPYPSLAPKEMFPVNYLYTIFVYDELDRLRYVLPPGTTTPQLNVTNSTVNNITTNTFTYSWTVPSSDQLSGICYSYLYNGRGKLIERKIPGKDVEYLVYDKRDRLVLSQDGNLKSQGKWMMNIYDALDRPIITGLVSSPNNRQTMESIVSGSTNYNPPDWRYFVRQTDIQNNYPANITESFLLSYTYYDNYDELGGASFNNSKIPALPSGDNSVVPSVYTLSVKGLVTGTKLRVLDPDNPNGNQWITSKQYYDAYGRLLQSVQTNHKGGIDISGNLYYFQGTPYENIIWHQNPSSQALPGANNALTDIKLDKTYKRNFSLQGGNDLVWNIKQRVNDGTPYELAYYDYNHLNQPVIKQYNTVDILHEYNIRGWLNHIQARKSTNHDINFFNETLHFDDGFASKLYNGAIAGTSWKYYDSLGSGSNNSYGYSYDKLNRLNHAEYRELSTGGLWTNSHRDYTTSSISYDDRGNILTMNQRGMITAPLDMDQLQYTYGANSNYLVKVKDNVTPNSSGSLPDFKDKVDLGVEYTYDNNGNLTSDANKEVQTLSYNFLNKPTKIEIAGKGNISFVYDATGNRLQKKITDYGTGTTEVWDYMGSFVYKNNVLQYILNEEGRSRPLVVNEGSQIGATKFVYDYFIKDHLGNVRSTITAQPIDQQYLALHEIATAGSEQLIFDNIAAVRDDKPGSVNPDDLKAAHLIANDPHKRIGTAIMLRVMPGDKFTFGADAYYESDDTETNEMPHAEEIVSSLLSALTGGTVGGIPVTEAGENASIINQALNNEQTLNFIQEQMDVQQNTNGPKAGLTYLYFDQNFKLMTGLSGKIGIPLIPGQFNNMSVNPTPMTEPGYVVVFVDNNSIGTDVWFDNVQISHFKGQVLEENHYYPFGLAINETNNSSNLPVQFYKFQGIELNKNFGLETYETFYRGLDPQLGRFNGIDIKSEKHYAVSPYVSMANNPISFIDPLGDDTYVYGTNGILGLIIRDDLPNQIHFMNLEYTGFHGYYEKADANEFAKLVRAGSVAFIGNKSVASAKKIAEISARQQSDPLVSGVEVGVVPVVGADREIVFEEFNVPKNIKNKATFESYPVVDAVDYYNKNVGDFGKLFGFGHTHTRGWYKNDLGGDLKDHDKSFTLKHLGTPSGSPSENLYDYRIGNVGADKPRFIISPVGVTIFSPKQTIINQNIIDYDWFKKN